MAAKVTKSPPDTARAGQRTHRYYEMVLPEKSNLNLMEPLAPTTTFQETQAEDSLQGPHKTQLAKSGAGVGELYHRTVNLGLQQTVGNERQVEGKPRF